MRLFALFLAASCANAISPEMPDASEPIEADAAVLDASPEDVEVLDGIGDAASIDILPPVELIAGRLALRTVEPAMCAACEDRDADGLSDAWEAIVLETFRPLVRIAEDDPFLTDPEAHLLQIARVFPVSLEPLLVRALIAVAWRDDYGSTCGGIGSHHGDPERVALELEALPSGGPHDVIIARAYTAGHEFTVADASRLFERADLDELEYTGEPRWAIYSSLSKHASFANVTLCEDAGNIPCLRETCSAGSELLPAAINAGEPDAPLIDDLTPHGFPGDLAWSDSDFCGGHEQGPCSGPLFEKLTLDPFTETSSAR